MEKQRLSQILRKTAVAMISLILTAIGLIFNLPIVARVLLVIFGILVCWGVVFWWLFKYEEKIDEFENSRPVIDVKNAQIWKKPTTDFVNRDPQDPNERYTGGSGSYLNMVSIP